MSLTPVELCARLDRDVAAAVGQAPPIVSLFVDRKGDDAFDITVMVSVPQGAFQKQVGSWQHAALDLASLRAVVAWSKPNLGSRNVNFAHWSGWSGSHEKNARELLRVFEARPTTVTVYRGTPYTERGEPPVGQPRVDLTLDANGQEIVAPLSWELTTQDDHDRVLARIQAVATELASALGVPCKTV